MAAASARSEARGSRFERCYLRSPTLAPLTNQPDLVARQVAVVRPGLAVADPDAGCRLLVHRAGPLVPYRHVTSTPRQVSQHRPGFLGAPGPVSGAACGRWAASADIPSTDLRGRGGCQPPRSGHARSSPWRNAALAPRRRRRPARRRTGTPASISRSNWSQCDLALGVRPPSRLPAPQRPHSVPDRPSTPPAETGVALWGLAPLARPASANQRLADRVSTTLRHPVLAFRLGVQPCGSVD